MALSFKVHHLATAADALNALPTPILHIKGYAKRLLFHDAPPPPHQLNMKGRGALSREKEAMGDFAQTFVQAVKAEKPATLVWDGDAHAKDSFTHLIPQLLAALPGAHLVAFALEDWSDGCQASWLPLLNALPAQIQPSSLTLVLVPAPTSGSGDDSKYVTLGRSALVATGASLVYCLGGGLVTAEEARLAYEASPESSKFALVPARRWKRRTEAPPATGAPLEMEESPLMMGLLADGGMPGVRLVE